MSDALADEVIDRLCQSLDDRQPILRPPRNK
jgi:hypothetical protein